MADNATFHLPDLGEGLPDATIVEWLVKEGDNITLDAPLVSMETAKAVVEVPSPYTGTVRKFHGAAGDVITTGAALADFELDPKGKQRAGGAPAHEAQHASAPPEASASAAPAPASATAADRADEGTVVGAVSSSNEVRSEPTTRVGGAKAVPAVRAMAKKMGVDLARVHPTGAGGVVTLKDVKDAAAGHAAVATPPAVTEEEAATAPASAPRPAPGTIREAPARTTVSRSGKPIRTTPPSVAASGQPEQLKGVRRTMARVMADAHARVVPTTSVDDADLHQWIGKQDITVRTIRAVVAACKAIPALNAWFDDANLTVTRHPHVDLGIAVDTEDGLFVPVLRNADLLDAHGLREGVNRLRAQVEDRSIPASELSGYTISLSNYGVFGGRYANPIVVPPCVAIVGVGKLSHDVVAVMGGIEVHRRLPVSVTMDHRAVTGGEAARFMRVILDDLVVPQ